MSGHLARRAGSALVWQALQHVGAKLIYFARIPILARLLLPDDFGLMAIAIIAVESLMTVTNFGLIPALVQRENAEERHYHAAWTVGLLRSLAVAAIVFFGAPLIADLFGEPRAAAIIRLLALRPLLQSAASIRVADLTRELQFRSLALLSLTDAALGSAVSIALARPLGVWALAVGALAGPAAQAVLSYVVAPYLPRLRLEREAAGALVRFGRWVWIVGLIALGGSFVLHAAISRRLGAEALGLYFLAGKLAFLPSDLATELVGKVAFPLYSRLQSDAARAAQAFRTLVTGMAFLLLPALGLLLALAPSLVEHVLGPRWEGTAPVVRILAVACLFGLFNEATVPIFTGLGVPRRVAWVEALQSLGLIVLAWPLAASYGLPGAAASWVPATLAAQTLGLAFLGRTVERPFRGSLVPLSVIAVAATAAALVAWLLDGAFHGALGFVLALLGAGAVYGGALALATRRVDLGLADAVTLAWPRVGEWLTRFGLQAARKET